MTYCGRCGEEIASEWGPHGCLMRQVWAVRDVLCVESLGRAVIEQQSRRFDVKLEPVDYDDTLQRLLEATVVLERKFDDRPGIIFRPWLYVRLGWAAIDHWRSPAGFGRHGQHRVLDANLAAADSPAVDDGPAGGHRPEPASTDFRDDPASGAAALEGFFALGDSGDPGPLGGPSQPDRLGAGRDAATGDGPARVATARASRELAPAHVDCDECGWRTYLQAPNGVTAWHVPDWCSACGAALGLQGAEVAA